jgi:tetratricopeptide (TPR) repeat protein
MLSAAAHRELTALKIREAAELETSFRHQRMVVRGLLDAAGGLQAMAEGRGSLDLDRSQAALSQQRQEIEGTASRFRSEMAELDGPIAQVNQEITADRQRVEQLSAEANALRREAMELGVYQGFGRFEEAVALEREADRVESQIAHREINLDYELLPAHRRAERSVANADGLLGAIDTSMEIVSQHVNLMQSDARTTLERVQELSTAIADRVDSINQLAASDLQTRYQAALDSLDQAQVLLSRATRGISRDAADSVRLATTRVQALRGQLHLAQLRGLSDHLSMLETLDDAADILGTDYQPLLAQTRQRIDEVRQQAGTAFDEAQQSLGSINARFAGPAHASLTNGLQTAVASLTGVAPPPPVTPSRGPAEAPPAASGDAAQAGGGAATARDLLDRIAAMGTDLEASGAFWDLCRASSPEGQAAMDAMRSVSASLSGIMTALTEQFGEGMGEVPGLGGGPPPLASAQIVSETDDTAVCEVQGAGGASQQVTLVRREDGWFVQAESLAASMPGGAQMWEQQAAMFRQLAPDLVRRIQAGEFATPMEAFQELMGAMMGQAGPSGTP